MHFQNSHFYESLRGKGIALEEKEDMAVMPPEILEASPGLAPALPCCLPLGLSVYTVSGSVFAEARLCSLCP